MYLIVGLGNPGEQYNFTRHNLGFLTLDFYFKVKGLEWANSSKYNSSWLKTNLTIKKNQRSGILRKTVDIIFIKPQTFYNNSGSAVANFANFYKIPHQNILILCDDFSLPFSKTRIRERGSDGGNNGLKSIIKSLGTPDFHRLRLGIANDPLHRKIGDTDFVLGRFSEEEKALFPQILPDFTQRIEDFLLEN